MADNSQHPLWCKHCEVEGHLVTRCHALYKELTNFHEAFKMAQGQASHPQNAHPVAHWGHGKKKRAYGPGPSVPPRGAPIQGEGHQSNPFYLLSPLEADALANNPEQQWAEWVQWETNALASYLDQQWAGWVQWETNALASYLDQQWAYWLQWNDERSH